jgi:hypothetical protein
MNSCMFTCVTSHSIGLQVGCSGTVVETLLSCGMWRIPVFSCRWSFGLCRMHSCDTVHRKALFFFFLERRLRKTGRMRLSMTNLGWPRRVRISCGRCSACHRTIPRYCYQAAGQSSPHFPANGSQGVAWSHVVSLPCTASSSSVTAAGLWASKIILRMTTAAGCSVSISQPSVADRWSMLHTKWYFEYSWPANKSTWKSTLLSRNPIPTAVCNMCLDGNSWRPSPRFLWATASTIRGFLFSVYITTITTITGRRTIGNASESEGTAWWGSVFSSRNAMRYFRHLLLRSIERTKKANCVVSAITRAHSCDFYLWGHLKSILFAQRCNTLQELWNANEAAVTLICSMSDVFQRARNSWFSCSLYALTNGGFCQVCWSGT